MRILTWCLLCAQLLLATPAAADNPFLRADRKKTIASITYFGNSVTREYVLRRALQLNVGDEWSRAGVADALERITDLRVIDWADIQEKTAGQEVHLVVTVDEAPLLSTRTEGLWILPTLPVLPTLEYQRRHDGLILGVRSQLINLRGRDETLDLYAGWLAKHYYRARWSNPHILRGAHLGLFWEADWNRYDFRFEPFRLTDYGVKAGIFRHFDPWVQTQLYYQHQWVEYDQTDLVFEGDSVDKNPSVELAATFDSRDLTTYPRKGIYARASTRFGQLDGDGGRVLADTGPAATGYRIDSVMVSGFVRLPYLQILGGRVAYRNATDHLPLYERTYLGGPNDLRGVEFGSIEGDRAYLATLELRYPLFLFPFAEGKSFSLGLHAFHDWGKAWEADASFDQAKLRYSHGAGLHLGLGIYNLRFEWARTDDGDNAFVFEDRMTF